MKSRKVIAGLSLLGLALLGWAASIIIPFTNWSHKGLGFVIAVSIAELSFLLALALLGKAYYHRLRDRIISYVRRK